MKILENRIIKYKKQLENENIVTWFDLGLFLDRLRENRKDSYKKAIGSYDDFIKDINKKSIAFLTYQYSVDGVSIEVEKYAKIFKSKFNESIIHYISGKFYPEAGKIVPDFVKRFELASLQAFDDWDLYKDFYFTKLQRGSKAYNQLITKFWNQTLKIFTELGNYVIDNKIELLYLINVCSNPGNVSFSLAVVLLSEFFTIPVINNNHDFYWEGGNREIDKLKYNIGHGPRDFFFTNSHIGEFFSIIDIIFPWQSRIWIHVNINKLQSEHLIKQKGINPANVLEIGTAIDVDNYQNKTKYQKLNTFYQFEKILSRYSKTLKSYSVNDVLDLNLISENNPKPILVGAKSVKSVKNFLNKNIIFLQPTRIISRKRIEIGFELVKLLFTDEYFFRRFTETKDLKLTIIITGPISVGHFKYFRNLILKFNDLLSSFNEKISNKIYLAFLFSEIDKSKFKQAFENPIGIPELYDIASLILLPSKTEGRGLPIIEAAACGTPIFCSRYYPENVYAEVIGENLPYSERLKVIEFNGKNITKKHIDKIIEQVFYPHKFSEEIEHNKQVIESRYSLKSLEFNVDEILYRLYRQSKSNRRSLSKLKKLMSEYKVLCFRKTDTLSEIINDKNREYLPGFGRLRFMLFLKSLIDPSFFRVEEQQIRGIAYNYAMMLLNKNDEEISKKIEIRFLNAVESIFLYQFGEVETRHDHSLPYRHRNKNNYLYQDFTIQELSGLINLLFQDIIKPRLVSKITTNVNFFTDFNLALSQLTSSTFLGIDDRKLLIEKLQANIPIVYFPGKYIKNELELFALESVRSRLELKINQKLNEDILVANSQYISPIYIMASEFITFENYSSTSIFDFLINGGNEELYLLFKYKIIQVIETTQLCVGVHLNQLGSKALNVLKHVKDEKGILITSSCESIVMTDIIDIDRFHIGKVEDKITESILGIPINSGYIQYSPAGIRTTLSYPTPVQTAKDFSDYFKSKAYKNLIKIKGEKEVLALIKKDNEEKMSPIKDVVSNISEDKKNKETVFYDNISGVYSDGMPWSGVFAKVGNTKKWSFSIKSSIKPKTVVDFIKNLDIKIAWNGGYILNAELVGKLGLSEAYIGSPLGLIISNNKILCPPLYCKPAILFSDDKIDIKRVSASAGISVSRGTMKINFRRNEYNSEAEEKSNRYYDLMYSKSEIETKGNIVVRLVGNVIKEIISNKPKVELIPVGLTLLIKKEDFTENWKVNDELNIEIKGFENIKHAIEAGPLLINNSNIALDMKTEGWKTQNSIRTQAARLDFTNMRGPKIAAGIDSDNNLIVLAINGRIRESVGATHYDMAKILLKFGVEKAMGFDPGGSSTLVVDGKTINISPYNKDYEKNIYSLPPEPRAVSNVIIGCTKK
ncbi:MAG: phosphodiester glycosidase family protein [Bacteroidales bacterium]|nr:phosphodiester glycosidase family protein [Bacteroidales bacterium]